jgi:hypothetical protein
MRSTALLLAALLVAAAAPAAAQTGNWTSTDVGAVTLAGSATSSNGVWTISGDGSDIWGTADSFQFLHQKASESGAITVRVADLQNTSPFAKAGLMVRDGLEANAATVIFDVKPDGGLELMWRQSAGAAMQFLAGGSAGLPVWLRLEWGRRNTISTGVEAWTSQDGLRWTMIGAAPNVSATPDVGVAITSHDSGQLTTARVDHLTLDLVVRDWLSSDVGSVGVSGGAAEDNGIWTVTGAGADIWGPADGFHFLRRSVRGTNQHVRVRASDLQNTNGFAKAGVMLRTTSDPDSPTVILDVKPDGAIEFMARETWGGEMTFLDGLAATPGHEAAWLDLSWRQGGDGQPVSVLASGSRDGISWFAIAGAPRVYLARTFLAGAAVTSHDITHATTAHLQGLSLLSNPSENLDIGSVGLAGNATTDFTVCCPVLIVEGAGTDIWGTADSFEFVWSPGISSDPFFNNFIRLDAAHAFAKGGLMYRDSLAPGAATVILDVKPDGGVEFMARLCTNCEMTFIGGAQVSNPVFLFLSRNPDGSFSASADNGNPATHVDLGSVVVPMSSPFAGYAVTSHDPGRTATAVFEHAVH